MNVHPAGPHAPWCPAVVIALVAILCAAGPVWSAERVGISSSIGGAIYYSKSGWVAVGGVTMTQGATTITADRMHYDPDRRLAVFSGNVRVQGGGDAIDGEQFTYDVEAGKGWIEEASAAFDVEGFSSPVYLLAELAEFGEGFGSAENARLTTCYPPGTSGYYLAARRIDVFPGDRMVIRSVRFVESGITLFYWPYVSIPLGEREGRRETGARLPEIGHNASDGWYVKTRYGYDAPGDDYGEIAIDWFEKKGIGTGVHHVYRSGDQGEGSVALYRLGNRATGHDDLSLGWDESFSLGPALDATWKSVYVTQAGNSGGEQREGRYSLAVDGRIAGQPVQAELAGKRLSGEQNLASDRLKLSQWGSQSGWRWRADADTYFLRGPEDRLAGTYALNVRKTSAAYTLNASLERRMHPAYFSESAVTPLWRLRTTMPSVLLTVDLANAVSSRIPVDLELGWARFSEEPRVGSQYERIEADRSSIAFRLQPGSVRLGFLGTVNYRAGLEYRGYSTDDRQVILSANYQYRLPLARSWSFYGSYSYQEPFGDPSPLSFDGVSAYERVTGRLQYSFARGSAFLSTWYDFRTGYLSELVGQLSYRPASGGLVSVQGGYSLVESRPEYVSANVSLQPSRNFVVNASTRYNFAESMVDWLAAGLTAAFLGWKLEYEANFDLDGAGGISQDVSVLRDLGCREVGLRYNSDAGSVWFEYRITALPGNGLRFGADRDGFQFDPESLSSLFRTETDE